MTRKICIKCGDEFKATLYTHRDLCRKCLNTLPLCDSCGTVMAPEYGFIESFARKVGDYDICGHCYAELRKKGFLDIGRGKHLMPSGQMKVKTLKARGVV